MSGPPMDVPRSEAVGAGGTGRRRLKRAAPGQPERGLGASRSPVRSAGGRTARNAPAGGFPHRRREPRLRLRRLRGGRESEPRSLVSREVAVKKKNKKALWDDDFLMKKVPHQGLKNNLWKDTVKGMRRPATDWSKW